MTLLADAGPHWVVVVQDNGTRTYHTATGRGVPDHRPLAGPLRLAAGRRTGRPPWDLAQRQTAQEIVRKVLS